VFPTLIVEEWIMPAIWTGTVVLWEVKHEKQERDQKKSAVAYKRVKHKDFKDISIYVSDDVGSEEVKPKIVAEYIRQKNDPALWEAYGNGLLQVYDIAPTIVTPPRIPENDE
jgi:hypothetical protein